mmetsp:Transcript_25060/g.44665  ORF Transcript_25060/g.44665 Transcript_25060/m.44665 type:complete len:113 (-) Transcript_25060:234-572(-)
MGPGETALWLFTVVNSRVSWFNLNQSIVFARWFREKVGKFAQFAVGGESHKDNGESREYDPGECAMCGGKEASELTQGEAVLTAALADRIDKMEDSLRREIDGLRDEIRSKL